MLITNFAAGELSKNLFGRTDLPQYYRGAARLDNFDVLPTGGIKRRSGTERVAELPGEGRLLPFMVNRGCSFLLYLTAGGMAAYKVEGGTVAEAELAVEEGPSPEEGAASFVPYQTLEEIRDVQYAQNFDTMILCHENYPPLAVTLHGDGLKAEVFGMSFFVKIFWKGKEKGNEIGVEDTAYPEGGHLRGPGNYPRCVTFFNGRLIFAGTANAPQRVFASRSGDIRDFSTFKTFEEEKKQYVFIRGALDNGEIKADEEEAARFTSSYTDYFIDHRFFESGAAVDDVLIEDGQAKIKLLPKSTIKNNLDDDLCRQWKNGVYADPDQWSDWYLIGQSSISKTVRITEFKFMHFYIGPETTIETKKYYLKFGKGENVGMAYHCYDLTIEKTREGWAPVVVTDKRDIKICACEIEKEEVEKCVGPQSLDYLKTYLKTILKIGQTGFDQDKYNTAVGAFYNYIKDTGDNATSKMCYRPVIKGSEPPELSGKTYYGTPREVYAYVKALADGGVLLFPFYTREVIGEDYPTPDCGFTFEVASDMNDSIRWLAANKGLIIGTETAEYIVPPDVHALNQQAMLNSRYGSDKIQGTIVGDATVFFKAGKKGLVEYYIPQQDQTFRMNDMAMLSPQMLAESPAVEFDFLSSPHHKLLVTREDGTVAALLYERGTGTFAWGKIAVGAGKVRSAAALPGTDGNDDAYFVVERERAAGGEGGGPQRTYTLERLREEGGIYLDCHTKIESREDWEREMAAYAEGGLKPEVSRVYTGTKKIIEEDMLIEVEQTFHEALPEGAEPNWAKGGEWHIGYPYRSVMRTMPVLANKDMKKQRIVALDIRFHESYMPKIKSIDDGRGSRPQPITNDKQPFTGIERALNPGGWSDDAQAELVHDAPTPIKMLAIYAEAQ